MAFNSIISLTSSTIGSYGVTGSNNTGVSWVIQEDATMSEFIEFALEIMGIDLTFSEFKNMSKSDRLTFIRDIKINKIIN